MLTNKYSECIICLDNIFEEESIYICPQCNIAIHTICKNNWFNQNSSNVYICPHCKYEISNNPYFISNQKNVYNNIDEVSQTNIVIVEPSIREYNENNNDSENNDSENNDSENNDIENNNNNDNNYTNNNYTDNNDIYSRNNQYISNNNIDILLWSKLIFTLCCFCSYICTISVGIYFFSEILFKYNNYTI